MNQVFVVMPASLVTANYYELRSTLRQKTPRFKLNRGEYASAELRT